MVAQPRAPLVELGPPVDGLDLGALLHVLRLRIGLSQTQLALRAGINVAYIHRLEKGTQALPSRRIVLALWEALETTATNRERLLVAAGLCPTFLLRLSPERFDQVMAHLEDC